MKRVRRLAVDPFHRRGDLEVYLGDCLEVVPALGRFDAVVTDPPYGLSFMGADWDRGVPGERFWRAVLEAVKPGGHLLAFGGTRTFHRLTCAIEDAGFEIRDCLSWLYGTGFPKSADVSKAIDRRINAIRLFDDVRGHVRTWRDRRGLTNVELNAAIGSSTTGSGMAGHWTSERTSQPELPSKEQWARLRALLRWPECELDRIYAAVKDGAARPVVATYRDTNLDIRPGVGKFESREIEVTAPASPEAARWEGWGTALKPGWEPVVLARRPPEGTVAENVLRWGVGALHVGACMVGDEEVAAGRRGEPSRPFVRRGRWPANVAHDGSEEVLAGLPGGSSRFFYCAKVSRAERGPGNDHPTVKPVALMRWLLRLVAPPGGRVLDPFAGSGSTLLAAREENLRAVGVELEPRYAAIAARRIGGPRRRVLA